MLVDINSSDASFFWRCLLHITLPVKRINPKMFANSLSFVCYYAKPIEVFTN